jgi:hypothetical protein
MADDTSLRKLASRCLWLSNNCFDLSAAAEMRAISLTMSAEAAETERQALLKPPAHSQVSALASGATAAAMIVALR